MSEKKCLVCKQVGTLKNCCTTIHITMMSVQRAIIRIYNEQNAWYAWNIYHEIT